MMEKASNVVNLEFVYKLEIYRLVYLCNREVDTCLDHCETTERTHHIANSETTLTQPCDEEVEHIRSLAIPDRSQQTDVRITLLPTRVQGCFSNEPQ